ncbi:MAG: hypothetical protein HC840_05430 [Leptolyngbyaceae cyanobacterium RM2_2_4]|nr:hypothetical protein [Leptolyngbyaceae cyanobacterium SM1_4_3]NJN88999.1 hypothetical protein [Leptolyngbyaceae cyanobacterium SL_5_14]NJO48998.1 hypothetical protein [Leptolyngbyaceae cyanobacterium RM2_2_4]NJO66725.1 hypothetical protein [Leptolyngbyaceae cyanobacterium RM1_405_57]
MIFFALFIASWVVAALLDTQAYFLGQSKPIHSRNWLIPKFHVLAESLTSQQIDYAERASSYDPGRYLARLD